MTSSRKPVTIKDIAADLGISPATVSRVLNGRGSELISERTRERVRDSARQLGYRANPAARALITGRSNMVALWLHNRYSFSPFVAQVVHSLKNRIHGCPVEMILEYIENPTGLGEDWTPLSRWPVDGILAHEAPQFVAAYCQAHGTLSPPIVGMGCWYYDQTDFVGIDLRVGVAEAVSHLLAAAPANVAYMVNRGSDTPGEPRYDAYVGAMERAGRPAEFILCDDQSRASARAGIREYVGAHGCPSAVFCHNDDLAIGAYRGLCDLGVRVPDDVALVGCDGVEDTEYLPCPISTIVQPIGEMCDLAWQYLRTRLGDPSLPPQQTVLTARLEVRASSTR